MLQLNLTDYLKIIISLNDTVYHQHQVKSGGPEGFSLVFLLKNSSYLNPFQANVSFLYPVKTSGKRFLTFLGGMEREHWPEIG